jgi:hypothetical protein
MNILKSIFGIFRQGGLVNTLKEGRPLAGFVLSAGLISVLGGALYGFAMGVGLGMDTAIKDAVKVGLIAGIGIFLTIPIFWVTYRLMGRDERAGQVAAVPLTLMATVSIILIVTAPIVFMLSVLVGVSPEAVYIHVVIVDVALIVGLYLAGTLIYHSFAERRQLVVPNMVGFLMMGVILVVLLSFFAPFLVPSGTFSVGTDRLKDGLGIGVAQKVSNALAAARAADRISYRFQTTNDNGDLTRDYLISRVGLDYLIEILLHAVPLEPAPGGRHIWILDGNPYTDFDGGRVSAATYEELASYFIPALPEAAFTLPSNPDSYSWRAYERTGEYSATGTDSALRQAQVVLETATGRLSTLTLGSAQEGLHAEVRVREITPVALDRAGLEALLNQAIVLGSVDRSDAALQDYVQDETFFAVRYPRDWRVGAWSDARREVEFSNLCGEIVDCPTVTVSVFDLAERMGAAQYAEDLAQSLALQAEYREIRHRTAQIGQTQAGVVEYLFDRVVRGQVETVQHIQYVFVGRIYRYHLDFSARESQFEVHRGLFAEIASLFTFLR